VINADLPEANGAEYTVLAVGALASIEPLEPKVTTMSSLRRQGLKPKRSKRRSPLLTVWSTPPLRAMV
jgi:hypothetical protein